MIVLHLAGGARIELPDCPACRDSGTVETRSPEGFVWVARCPNPDCEAGRTRREAMRNREPYRPAAPVALDAESGEGRRLLAAHLASGGTVPDPPKPPTTHEERLARMREVLRQTARKWPEGNRPIAPGDDRFALRTENARLRRRVEELEGAIAALREALGERGAPRPP